MNLFYEKQFKEISKKAGLVGAASVVVEGKHISQVTAYGYQSYETKELVSNDTIFRIASISKIIVAMSVMKLVEKGKISIKEDLGDIFGFKIRNPKHIECPITIEMLMTQTSSISDGFDDENLEHDGILQGYNGVNGTRLDVSLEDLLVPNKSIYWTDKTFNDSIPGTKFEYSNFGCGILACIVEKVSGRLFTEFVKDEILYKLELDASFRADEIKKQDKIATLYFPSQDDNLYKIARTGQSFIDNVYPIWSLGNNYRGPAGGLFISMIDLSKIMMVLMHDGSYQGIRILKKETVDLMLEQHWNGTPSDSTYRAKGLQIKVFDYFEDHLLKGHSGDAYGVKSFMFFNKEENVGICYITNGGYYKKASSGLSDCQEETIDLFIKEYWPKTKTKYQFSFDLNQSFGFLNYRKIHFPIPSFQEEDVFLPFISLGEGLSVIVKETTEGYSITKYKKTMKIFHENVVDKKGILCFSVNKVCKELELKLKIENTKVIIDYESFF